MKSLTLLIATATGLMFFVSEGQWEVWFKGVKFCTHCLFQRDDSELFPLRWTVFILLPVVIQKLREWHCMHLLATCMVKLLILFRVMRLEAKKSPKLCAKKKKKSVTQQVLHLMDRLHSSSTISIQAPLQWEGYVGVDRVQQGFSSHTSSFSSDWSGFLPPGCRKAIGADVPWRRHSISTKRCWREKPSSFLPLNNPKTWHHRQKL